MANSFVNPLGLLLQDYYALATWTRPAASLAELHNWTMDEISAHAGILTTATCTFSQDGSFDFDDDGEESVVIEVLSDDEEDVVDLCAWAIGRPQIFGTVFGNAAILGAANIINPASWALGRMLKIHRTPLSWLCDDCRGAVILDHRWAPYVLSQALGFIEAEDTAHCRDLKLMLCQPPVSPASILVPVEQQRRAA